MIYLKGKFSSGIERDSGRSSMNIDSLYFIFDVFKVYFSSIDSETAEI